MGSSAYAVLPRRRRYNRRMDATARTWILMLAVPPAFAFLWAYAMLPFWPGSGDAMLAAAVVTGVAGIATAPWQGWVKLAAAAVCAPAAILALAFLFLIALCSTGRDCL
jgi:hypothetical protein